MHYLAQSNGTGQSLNGYSTEFIQGKRSLLSHQSKSGARGTQFFPPLAFSNPEWGNKKPSTRLWLSFFPLPGVIAAWKDCGFNKQYCVGRDGYSGREEFKMNHLSSSPELWPWSKSRMCAAVIPFVKCWEDPIIDH